MKQLIRIKVRESIDLWNEKNPTKKKKTALTISKNIGINNRNLSLWNKEAPKQVKALYELSNFIRCNFDDLFECDEKGVLIRIRISELLNGRTFKLLSCMIVNSSESRLRLWDQGKLPFSIVNFFNFCKDLRVKPNSILEY